MSIASLTTLAAVRDSRAPTRADVGKKPPKEDPTKEERAKLTDLLVTAVPTELVAPYTAAMALIVGLVDEPTKKVPVPDQLEPARWIIFGFLVLATATAILRGKRSKGTRKRAPVLEVATGLVAAVGWAFALPDSPLTPYLDGKARAYVPVIVAFGAVALIMILGGRLKEPAKT